MVIAWFAAQVTSLAQEALGLFRNGLAVPLEREATRAFHVY